MFHGLFHVGITTWAPNLVIAYLNFAPYLQNM